MTERTKHPNEAAHPHLPTGRTLADASALLAALFLPPILLPRWVPAGATCDLLVAGFQILLGITLLGIVLAIAVPRNGSPWRDVLVASLAVGSYWAVVRLGLIAAIPLAMAFSWLYLRTPARPPAPPRGSHETVHPARRLCIILLLLVCMPLDGLIFILWPHSPAAPTEVATLLLALAAVVVLCVWLGVHMKE
ncbi:MAG: hypothetical protein JXQ73_29990 [Phycisphaerae bacterium]|nr:hypothetical protein [Phycisphaerae bacterium]